MAKKEGFSNSFGDKLLESWGKNDKTKDAPQNQKTTLASKKQATPVQGNTTAMKKTEAVKPAPHVIKKKLQLNHLSYQAEGKEIGVMKNDYLATTQTGRRRTITDGIRAHFYDLQKKPAKQETIRRLSDLQNLLNEIQQGLSIQPKSNVLQKPLGLQDEHKKTVNAVADKAPDRVKKSRSIFGKATQFKPQDGHSEICDVVIGLDFGTACSKVALRTPYHQDRTFVIPFGTFGHSSCRSLLPTHLSLQDNHYHLPSGTEKATKSDLKMRLLGSLSSEDEHLDAIEDTIAYLALVFRYVRTWFLREQNDAYGQYELFWHINIGVPSATAGDESLCHLYNETVATAWAFSIVEGDISVHKLIETKNAIHLGVIKEDDIPPIHIIPEMAAEVAGYTQSDLRQDGLHLLIDIGAGTLDICGFNVIKINNESRLPLFSTSVEPKGVKSLHFARKKAVVASIETCIENLMPDAAAPLKEITAYEPCHEICIRSLAEAEAAFFQGCKVQLFRLAQHLKTMHPTAQEWKTKFRVFLCGGGCNVPFYKNLVGEYSNWLRQFSGSSGAILIDLPRHDRIYGDFTEDSYHRFGVAVGLSHSVEDLDRVMTNIKPIVDERAEAPTEPWFMKREFAYLLDY